MPLKEIEKFSVSRLQVLDEDGNLDEELEPKLTQEELIRLYRAMVLSRAADDRSMLWGTVLVRPARAL